MKRVISLVLAILMLVTVTAVPVSAAEKEASISLSVVPVTIENKTMTEITGEGHEYTADSYFLVKVNLENGAAERYIQGVQLSVNYDPDAVVPYRFNSSSGRVGYGIAPAGFSGSVESAITSEGTVQIGLMTSGWIYVDANATAHIASFLFQVKSTAETGSYEFAINTEAETIIEALVDPDGTRTAYIDCDYSEAKYDLAIKGATPTLASVSIDETEAEYASGKELTLSAKSASDKDLTDFVTFTIKDYTGDGLAIDGNKLTVSAENPANVGIYTVVATPDGTNCKLAEGASAPEATFTIIPKKITNPKVAITGFAKGNDIHWDLKIEPKDTAGLISNGVNCYEGPEVTDKPTNSGKFKPDTTYTFAITLDAMENYELGEGTLTYTINGGEETTTPIVEKNDFGTPYYQAVVTATTAGLDSPTLALDKLNAAYGDLLSSLIPNGTATFNGQTVAGTFAWADKYDENTTVGDAGERTFDVVFTPTDKEVYATVTGTVTVTVAQKEIEFKTSDYEWKSINPDDTYTVDSYGRMCFQYDGNEHGIEPNCKNDDIRDLVEFEYVAQFTTNKSTNVIGSTVKAQVLLKNNNYKFDKTSTVIKDGDWKVVPIVIDYAGEYTHSVDVCYTTSSVDIPLSAFGLPENVLNDTNNKYWMRTDAVVGGDVEVLPMTPTSFDEATRTLTLNLKSGLTKDDAGKTATVTLGLKVNNYETTNPGVEGIANKEEKLFILKLTVNIIEKEDAGLEVFGIPKTMVYGDTVRAGSPDGYYYTVKKEGKNATFSAMISDTAVVAFDDDNGLVAKGVGTAKITVEYDSDTTYDKEEFTIEVTPKPLTATVSHAPIIYGDAAPTTGYSVEFEGLVNNDEIAEDAYTVDTEYTKGCKVDNYKFTCVLDTDKIKNYTIGNVTGELVVNPKSIAAPSVTINNPTDKTYTGSPCVQGVSVKDSEAKLTFDDISVTYENNINVGTATIIYTGKNNYTGEIRKNFKITEASITDDMIANIPSVTYNTRAHTPDVTVTFEGSTLEAGKDYDVAYTNNINAGTATVTVTGKGNFTGTASKTFTINKAGLTLNPCTISELCTETDLKTRTLPSDFFLAGETETGFSIKLTAVEGGDDIFAVAPAVVEGENKITFKLKNEVGAATFTVTVTPVSGNYNGGSYALTISTHDRTDVSGSISFPDGSAVYTGTGIKYENATISGYSGTLRYGYTPNASTGASLDASGLPLTVGTYTVAVTFNSDASFGYKTATFTITKATPTGTPGYTKLESSGKTLADAKLTVGTIRPAGTIAWDLPLTTVLEDGKAYAWTFTPADTHNYTILTGTLVPYVDDGMDYIPGVIGGNTGSFNFHDVSRFDYFYDAVKWAAENGIASGTGRYTFSPNAVCTRAQTVTFLWRAAGSPLPRYRVCPFTDVQPSDYYYNAVLWAVEQGITTGLNATTFGPDVTVTRGQVATFLYRAASAAKSNTFNPFTDVKTTAYNYDAILWAYDNRITTGTSDTTFSPDVYCTRAQIVTFLYRYYQGR